MSSSDRYKHVRVEGTPYGIVAVLKNRRILAGDEIQEVGTELLSVAEIAIKVDMPLFINFEGVEAISSAVVGKIVLLNKKEKASGIRLYLYGVCPMVEEVFRKLIRWSDEGDAGSLALV